MTEKRESNYEIASRKMRAEFLNYDQERMIQTFHLERDAQFLYLDFCGLPYRVDRKSGLVEHAQKPHALGGELYEVSMSVYDALCSYADPAALSGRYTTWNNLDGVVYSSGLGEFFLEEKKKVFDHRTEAFRNACVRLGGIPVKKGDAAFLLPAFSFLPVLLIFYDADEEFSSSLQLLWDEQTLSFVHYETTYAIAGVLLDHLAALLGS